MAAGRSEEVRIDRASMCRSHDQQIVRPYGPVQTTVLNQTWFEVDEWLLRFDLEGSCSSIAAEFCTMNVAFPVKFSANDQSPYTRWITDAKPSFEVAS